MNYLELDIYDELFNDYYKYIKSKVNYSIEIAKKTPQKDLKFPSIIFKEVTNVNAIGGTSTDRTENVDLITYQIDIYTKDFIDDNGQHPSFVIQKELKLLTFDYFFHRGFDRTSSDNWENNNVVYDRLTLLFQGGLQSWNKRII